MRSARITNYRVAKIDDGNSRIELEFTTHDDQVIGWSAGRSVPG